MKLGDAFDITIGMVLSRKKAKDYSNEEHKYRLLSLKSIDDVGNIDETYLDEFISKEQLEDTYLTQREDVVIRLTEPYCAAYIDEGYEGLLVSSNFGIIRKKHNLYEREFIKYYINSIVGKRAIRKSAAGTALTAISITSLKELEINQYDLATQQKFIEINKLFENENNLLSKLMQEKSKQLDGINYTLLK